MKKLSFHFWLGLCVNLGNISGVVAEPLQVQQQRQAQQPPADPSLFDAGLKAYTAKDYATALIYFTPLAEQGNTNAQYMLARMYWHGLGVESNATLSTEWARKAAALGHKLAKNELERIDKLAEDYLFRNARYTTAPNPASSTQPKRTVVAPEATATTTEPNPATRALPFKMLESSDTKDAHAAKSLPYSAGLSAYRSRNYAAALKHFKPLAERGDAHAQYYLGVMHTNGEGVAKHSGEAAKWYYRAAVQGHEEARQKLRDIAYSRGAGT